MSDSESGSGAGRREVAYRLFAREFDDATVSYSESEEERAPNYVISPTGGRVNRLFLVGVLTELERVNEDMLRARIVDPTGPFVVYAGQYQPDALSFLEGVEPPTFLAVTGKARTFQPEDSDQVYTSVRPESISEVDAETRDRWVVQTAEQTLDRVATMAAAKQTGLAGDRLREALAAEGVDDGLAHGIALALDRYGTTGEYLAAVRGLALDAARVVADRRDEVEPRPVAPGEGGEADLDALAAEVGVGDVATTDAGTAGEAAGTTAESEGRAGGPDEQTGAPTRTADQGAGSLGTGDSSAADASAESTEPEPGSGDVEPEPESGDAEPEPESGDEPAAETTADTPEPAGAGSTEPPTGDEDLGDFEAGEFDLDEEEREELEAEYGTEFETGTEVDEPGEAGIEPDEPSPEPDGEPPESGADAGATAGTAETEPAAGTEAEPEPASETQSGSGATGESEAEPPVESDVEATAEPETGDRAEEPDTGAGEPAEAEAEADDAEPGDDEAPVDVEVDEALMETMADLADGEGADRQELVATVAEEYGFDPAAVEDAIQDALMSGQCYEPDEGKLKPI